MAFGQCDRAPIANFVRSDNFVISGQGVTFRNNSIPNGNNVRYIWNWGDNTPNTITTNLDSVTHVYSLGTCTHPNDAIGSTFTLTLTIQNLTDPFCGDFTSAPVTVYRPNLAMIVGTGWDTVCAGVPMNFINGSCPRNSRFTYLWNFGDPSSAPLDTTTSAVDRVTHTYNRPGNYTVTLRGSGFGLSTFDTMTVVVLPQVFARATYTATGNCAPVEVALNNTSTDAENVTYIWSMASNATFGNGTTARSKNPVMNFTQTGSHSIHLETRHRCGNRRWDSIVVVYDKPTVALDPIRNVCIPNPTTAVMQNISTGGLATTYNWTFQDALPATFAGTNPPPIAFQSEGIKTVQLTATNNCGNISVHRTVEVGVPPVINAIVNLPVSHCAPFTVFTHNSSVGNITNTWTVLTETGGIPPNNSFIFINNTNYNSARPEFQFLKQGSYKLKLTIANPCDTKTWESAAFTVKAPPISVIDTILPSCNNVYTPNLLTFEEGGLATTYDWRFQNSQPASANMRTISAIRSDSFGIQRIEITATNACGSYKDTTWVQIRPHAVLDVGLQDTTPVNCAPFRVETKNRTQYASTQVWSVTTESGNVPPIGSYEFLDNTNANSIAPVVNFILQGKYFLKLTITNPCKDTVWKSPLIQVQIKPEIQMDSILKSCPPLVVTPEVDTLNGGAAITHFTWQCTGLNFVNPNQFDPSPLNFNTAGRHLLRLIAQNRCGIDTTERIVEVTQPAVIQVNMTTLPIQNCLPFEVNFTNQSVGAVLTTWTVTPNGNATVLTNTPELLKLNFATAGTYNIRLNITNPCGDKSWDSTIVVHDKPSVRLQPLVLSGSCTPQTVQPSGVLITHGGLPTQILWNHTTDTILTPAPVVYNTSGTFPVTLEARNACGTSIDRTSFTIQERFNLQIRSNRDTFCNTNAPYPLTYAPQNGFWAGAVTRTGLFSPALAGVGQHVLTYQAGTGDCVVKDSITMFVYGTIVSAGVDMTKCDTASAPFQLLGGTPAGGWWTGRGITDAQSGTFSPSIAGAGEHILTYHYQESIARCENTATRKVTIFRKPKAIIGSLPINCTNTAIPFNNLSAAGLTAQWSFGDNLSSTALSPTHIYTQAGTYPIRLIVRTLDGCADTTERSITIARPAVPRFSVVPAAGCTDLRTTINNDGSQNNVHTRYLWNFGNGDTSNQLEPGQMVFKNWNRGAQDTLYTIRLTATNTGCPSVTDTHTVRVFSLPRASFGISADTICSTDSVTFNNVSLGCATYRWDLGNSIRTQVTQPAQQQYLTDTIFKNYYIQLIGSNQCGSDTVTRKLTVRPITTRAFFTLSSNKGCPPFEVQLTNRATLGAQVNYHFGDHTTSNLPNPTHTFTQAGQYFIKQYAKLGCGYDTIVQKVTVYTPPPVDFEYATLICRNRTMIFTNLSGQNITTARWQFGDHKSSNEVHPTHRYDTSGSFRVSLTIQGSDSNQCYATVEKRIPILPELSLNLDSIIQTKCFAATGGAVLSGRNGVLPYLYALNNPNSFSNASGVFTNLDINRSYTIYMKDAEGCRDSQKIEITGSRPFTINVGGNQEISLGDSVLMAAAASNTNVSWRWTGKEGIFCDTCSTTYLKPFQTTLYRVYAIDRTGCKNQDSVLITVIPTYKVFIPNVFSPNGDATNDYFYPQTDRSIRRVINFQVFNRVGGMVFQRDNFAPNDMYLGWDGLNGDTGVYAYWMEVEFLDGKRGMYKGDVTLVR